MSIIGSLIGAGASLLGGVLSSSSKKKQAQQQYENDIRGRNEQREYDRGTYDRLVVDAERAGFNPLTALRNGGGAYYNASSAAAPLSRQATAGVGSEIGNSLQTIGANWLVNFDPHADAAREQGARLIDAQIANLNASTAEFTQRHAMTTRNSGALSKKLGAAVTGLPIDPEEGETSVTNPWQTAVVDPNIRDAGNFEQRYGDSEIAQMLYGAYVGYNDYMANAKIRMQPYLSAVDKAAKGNENRKSRIKKDAAKNARDLGFSGY